MWWEVQPLFWFYNFMNNLKVIDSGAVVVLVTDWLSGYQMLVWTPPWIKFQIWKLSSKLRKVCSSSQTYTWNLPQPLKLEKLSHDHSCWYNVNPPPKKKQILVLTLSYISRSHTCSLLRGSCKIIHFIVIALYSQKQTLSQIVH